MTNHSSSTADLLSFSPPLSLFLFNLVLEPLVPVWANQADKNLCLLPIV